MALLDPITNAPRNQKVVLGVFASVIVAALGYFLLLSPKQTERDALRAEQLAWAGQMAAGIAHEVRNPLMAIKVLIQALASGRTADRLRPRDVQVLEEEIIRLEQIVSSFLDFARPPQPDAKPVEVVGLVEQQACRILELGRDALRLYGLGECHNHRMARIDLEHRGAHRDACRLLAR